MKNLKLNIYDKSGKEVVKTYEASTYDLMFGTVMELMELLKIEELDNQAEMLKTIYKAWGEIRTVLDGVFEGVSADEWKNVKVKELLPLIVKIAKFSISEMFAIPTSDEKN